MLKIKDNYNDEEIVEKIKTEMGLKCVMSGGDVSVCTSWLGNGNWTILYNVNDRLVKEKWYGFPSMVMPSVVEFLKENNLVEKVQE